MIFYFQNKNSFISECRNYTITTVKAGTVRLFSCYRIKSENPETWDNINEFNSYLTFQLARIRIAQVHKLNANLAFRKSPKDNKITQEKATRHRKKIRRLL